MITELLQYLKHPFYQKDDNTEFKYRITIFVKLLVLSLCSSLLLGMVLSGIEALGLIDLGEHALETIFKEHSPLMVFFLAVILAPLLEELIFRGPLSFFKNSTYFNYFFYLLVLLFGLVHLSNFKNPTELLLWTPLLIAPQLAIGCVLGFIRVRFGLLWSMALHAAYNCILMTPVLILHSLGVEL